MNSGTRRIPVGPRKLWATSFVALGAVAFALTSPTVTQAFIFAGLVVGLLVTTYLLVDLKRSINIQARDVRRGLRYVSRSFEQARPTRKYANSPAVEKRSKARSQTETEVRRAQERLWLGFPSRALSVLSSASTDIAASPATRSAAFLEQAVWHAANNDWVNALETVRLARVADPTPDERQIALEIDALIATGSPLVARQLLHAQRVIPKTGPAFHLRSANTYFVRHKDPARFESDGQRLKHINQLYREEGLIPLVPARPGEALTIGNLMAASLNTVSGSETVTVIMPAHNAEKTLQHSVCSILSQTWPNIELIIVDDASDDNTAAIAQEFANLDSRVKFVRLSVNSGPYVARNEGLRQAEGALITVHDADDWAHPQKIQKQVESWRASAEARASVSFHARVSDSLEFLKPTRRHRVEIIARNLSSLMVERSVFDEIGPWDQVRAAGDSEFVDRLRVFYGRGALVETCPSVPLALSLSSSTSLTRDTTTGFASMNHVLGARSQYRAAFREWHRSPQFRENLPLQGGLSSGQPFLRPKVLTAKRHALAAPEHFDVILVSNLSLPGGTTASNVQELRAQKQAGMKTGLIHHPVYDWGASRPPNPKILREVDGELVRLLSLGERVSCDLLVVRLPKAIETLIDDLPAIDAGKIVVLANQTPDRYYRPDGVRVRAYDLEKCTAGIRQKFGKDPMWYPIGPRVRQALIDWHSEELDRSLVSDSDWVNIIDLSEWRREPRISTDSPFRIGRHSRDSDVKWPTDPRVLREAYPENSEFQISVLGGATIPERALGGLPSNWEVFPFDSIHPREFLATLDVYVYFTPPGMIEAFGRGLLEALAVGVPLVTSREFEELFGDAAIYAEPHMVTEIVRELRDNPDYYARQVERGHDLIEEKFSYGAHIRRVRTLAASRT